MELDIRVEHLKPRIQILSIPGPKPGQNDIHVP
jgi:hypothetical protein